MIFVRTKKKKRKYKQDMLITHIKDKVSSGSLVGSALIQSHIKTCPTVRITRL